MRLTPRLALWLIVLCLLSTQLSQSGDRAVAGTRDERIIPSAKLQEDVDVLKRVLETVHPGLYRYNTKAQLDSHFDTLRAAFGRDRTLAEAYLAISQFLAKIKCGHSYANFYNQSKSVADALFEGRNRVPFCFRWINGRMIVTENLSSSAEIKRGTEILAINGIEATKILAALLTVARADGGNDAKRIASLEVLGTAKFEAFDPAAKEDRDGFFRMTKFDDDDKGEVIAPVGRRYEGHVVVLVGAANSSATCQFAQVVKEHRLATLVGQTTGGNQRGINGSAFFFVTLPNSRIEFDLPLVATFSGDDRPTGRALPFQRIADAGIEPDVLVTPSIDDIASGVDAELRVARTLLEAARDSHHR